MTGTGDGNGSRAEKLGYLGLGMMGVPMARRLLDAGHELAIWNRSAAKAKSLVEAGAKLVADPREYRRIRKHHLHVRDRCHGG